MTIGDLKQGLKHPAPFNKLPLFFFRKAIGFAASPRPSGTSFPRTNRKPISFQRLEIFLLAPFEIPLCPLDKPLDKKESTLYPTLSQVGASQVIKEKYGVS